MQRASQAGIDLVDRRCPELIANSARQAVSRAIAVVVGITTNQSRIRRSGLKLDNGRDRVVAEQCTYHRVVTPVDGMPLVDRTENKSVRNIGIGNTVICAGTKLVFDDFCIIRSDHYDCLVRPLVLRFRISVGGNELESARESLSDLKRETVVKRTGRTLEDADAVVLLSSRPRERRGTDTGESQECVGNAIRPRARKWRRSL